MRVILLTTLLWIAQTFNYASAFRKYAGKTRAATAAYSGPTVPQFNISMPVDHFDSSSTQSYENRYWINDTYYQPGGPVFFYDVGEEGVTDQMAAAILAEVDLTTAIMRLAEKYGGLALLWEHRYFGRSLPVPLNRSSNEPDGGFNGYEYLTLEQAFEDVVYFAQKFCPDTYSDDHCEQWRPSNAPWVWIGGSYSGTRGAVIRIRNPDIFYAVWSSSAPLQAMYDGSAYFNPIEAAMPSNCSTDVRAIIEYADEIMSGYHGEEAFQELRRLTYANSYLDSNTNTTGVYYNISGADETGTENIGLAMSEAIFSDFQSIGPAPTLDHFCNYLEAFDPEGTPSNTSNPEIAIFTNPDDGQISDQGLVATYNASVGLSAYFYALRLMFAELIKLELNGTIQEAAYDLRADNAAWTYLVYTVMGWFTASNPENVTIVSQYYNSSSLYETRARAAFSDITAADFNGLPNSTLLNKYGGWNANPSNVMFTAGEFDPWRGWSVLSEETQIGAPLRNITQDVPQCGTAPSGTDVFGVVLPGAVHAQDLFTLDRTGLSDDGTQSMAISLPLFEKALDAWLPCFNSTDS